MGERSVITMTLLQRSYQVPNLSNYTMTLPIETGLRTNKFFKRDKWAMF